MKSSNRRKNCRSRFERLILEVTRFLIRSVEKRRKTPSWVSGQSATAFAIPMFSSINLEPS